MSLSLFRWHLDAIEKAKKYTIKNVDTGAGRYISLRIILDAGINTTVIIDAMPVPHNVYRPPKKDLFNNMEKRYIIYKAKK